MLKKGGGEYMFKVLGVRAPPIQMMTYRLKYYFLFLNQLSTLYVEEDEDGEEGEPRLSKSSLGQSAVLALGVISCEIESGDIGIGSLSQTLINLPSINSLLWTYEVGPAALSCWVGHTGSSTTSVR